MQMNPLKIIRLTAVVMAFGWGTGVAWADWSFAIMGDTRGHHDTATGISDYLTNIAAKVAENHPDLVLVSGDQVSGDATNGIVPLTYAQQFDNWTNAMNPMYALNIPVYTVRGNHENNAGDGPPLLGLKQAYYDALGVHMPTNGPTNGPTDDQRGYTYSFAHSNATFMVIDQYFYPATPSGGYHRIDQVWLGQQLQQADTPYKIVMAHVPVYLDHFYGTNPTGMANRAEFWDSLGTHGVRLYICGHVHNVSVSLAPDDAGNGIYQLLSGNGGAELDNIPPVPEAGLDILYSNTTHYGFALATVGTEKMTIDYYLLNSSGETWSKASYTTTISAVIPEPSSGILLVTGLLGLHAWRRRPGCHRIPT
ncbi:MAG: metallophosphoesterase [bacterium]|nr:metallophosphoesterase [bacterium]